MENRKAVVLQAHIDMVPQANADTQHDFTTDPIDAYIDGEWVTARGTTLGADNGMGMAGCLAVLADKTIKHGPLEVLLTTDEETGMTGAFGLEAGWLEGGSCSTPTPKRMARSTWAAPAGWMPISASPGAVAATEGEGFELQVRACAAATPGSTSIAAAATPTSCWSVCSRPPNRWGCAFGDLSGGTCATPSPRGPCQPAGARRQRG